MRRRILGIGIALAVVFGSPIAAHATLTGVQCPATVRNSRTNEQVVLCQGFDVSPGMGPYTIAAYGELAAYQGVQGYPAPGVHVQIDRINLGSPNGVLASGGPANGQTGFVSAYSSRVGYDCAHEYRVRVYFSVRWSNGSLSSGLYGPLTVLPRCTTQTVAPALSDPVVPEVITVSS